MYDYAIQYYEKFVMKLNLKIFLEPTYSINKNLVTISTSKKTKK